MRTIVLAFLFPSLCFAEDWSHEDTYRQSALTFLLVADWAQTRTTAKTPSKFAETNKLLGEHPSVGQVNNYFLSGIVGHAAISYLLPSDWRKGWQYVWIGIEAQKVYHNRSIGVQFSF